MDRPLQAHLEVERAGSPWDRALKTESARVPTGEWTELHGTFTVDKPYAEGWQAYIGCSQSGGRFRADALRLYEGQCVPWDQATSAANLLTNASFEDKLDKWWLRSTKNHNKRRTHRRLCFALSRILANMGVSAQTTLLEHFRHPLRGNLAEGGVCRL